MFCPFYFSPSLLSRFFFLFFSPQYWRQVYLVMVLAMTLAEFFAQIHPLYLTKKWQKLRSVIFCSVVAYGLIPTIHWIWLSGGFSSEIVQVCRSSSSAKTFWIRKICKFYLQGINPSSDSLTLGDACKKQIIKREIKFKKKKKYILSNNVIWSQIIHS